MSKKLLGLSRKGKQPKKSKNYTSATKSKKAKQTLKIRENKQLDLSDIPEINLKQLGKPTVGKFYRPIKKPISIRLDADVLAWFKGHPHYQSLINQLCRIYMYRHQKK